MKVIGKQHFFKSRRLFSHEQLVIDDSHVIFIKSSTLKHPKITITLPRNNIKAVEASYSASGSVLVITSNANNIIVAKGISSSDIRQIEMLLKN
ncbi:MAG TPA: hypothetical protein VLH16_01790 [Bacteroidales bacterium]|nr:hypothetical protein [Bacteroidales bacterium]